MRFTSLPRHSCLFLAAALALAPSASFAFDTVTSKGECVHDDIIKEALKGLASEEHIKIIMWAAAKNDAPGTERFLDPRHHFDSNKIDRSLEWIAGRMLTAIAQGTEADANAQKREWSLEAVGDLLHSIQDFYSHSNYIEIRLKAGVAPDEIEPIDWGNRPAGLKTGYYYWVSKADNELSADRAVIVAHLQKEYFEVAFATEEEKAALRGAEGSYEGALAWALSNHDFLHYEFCKDSLSYDQAKIVHPGSKKTFFEIAKAVAVKETRRQWKIYLDGLRKEAGDRASAVISAVSGMKIDVPAEAGKWTAKIEEHPFKGGTDFWSVRHEQKGDTLIVHLVQDPSRNSFDRENPKLSEHLGFMAEMGSTYKDMRKGAEEDCEKFRKNGPAK